MEAVRIGHDTPVLRAEPAASRVDSETLPWAFLAWLSSSRMHTFEMILRDGPQAVRSQPSHLPVVATVDGEGSINLATKGLGPLPKEELLDDVTAMFRKARAEDHRGRIGTAARFYGDPGNFDPRLLGGLEIFEGRTYQNLIADGRASLLFTGEAPGYVSFQLDGRVEIVGPGDRRYEFLLQARELFARDPFHIQQKAYPHGYLFHPLRSRAKTPFSRRQ